MMDDDIDRYHRVRSSETCQSLLHPYHGGMTPMLFSGDGLTRLTTRSGFQVSSNETVSRWVAEESEDICKVSTHINKTTIRGTPR